MIERELYEELRAEERMYEARIERYFELQEIRRLQERQRQRALNGGYTDDELRCDDDDIDEEEAYGIV